MENRERSFPRFVGDPSITVILDIKVGLIDFEAFDMALMFVFHYDH